VTDTAVQSPRLLDGRYELGPQIGQGTFGRVYRGYDHRLARPVAVKVIKPWWTEDPQWSERFEREAQLMARVSAPGIVQIYDIGHAEQGLYYVAELVDGESLADRLRRGPLRPSDALDMAEQLCRALAQAHAQRVVHRDVKPANVLINREGQVKVGDFGVARLAEGTSDGPAGTIMGTPRYMAPEQARGRNPTPATDVYGVGVVLYEMLAGRPPFVERSAVELALRHLNDPPPPLPAHTPRALASIVERALAKEPADRYPTAAVMAAALERARPSLDHAQSALQGPRSVVDPDQSALERPRLALDPDQSPPERPRLAAASLADPGLDTAATAMAQPVVDATRVAPRRTQRRYANPAESRRYRALLGVVLVILAGLIVGAVITASHSTTVPTLRGLGRAGVLASLRHANLRAAFKPGYSSAPRGTVIAQSPAAGTRVSGGSLVRVTLSAGLPPVAVPQLVGQPSPDAQATLSRLGLAAAVSQVAAPGVTPGLVVRQSPRAAADVAPHSRVALSVAETPRWRPLTSFAGDGDGQSVPFRIRGSRWRIVYGMAYDGTCTFIFFCNGPSAQVNNLNTGATINQFDLNDASGQTQVFNTGPGVFQVSVSAGSDSAHWQIRVQDDY
jgi:serine/threonine-protein kinase